MRPVGRAAVILGVLALTPIALLVVVGRRGDHRAPWRPFAPSEQSLLGGLGLGLAVMMWNYSGWDAPSTTLGETRSPERAYRLALFIALPVIALAYVLPVAVALGSGAMAWTAWDTGTLPRIAAAIGGRLARPRGRGGCCAEHGRALPLAAADQLQAALRAGPRRLLGAWLGRLHPRFGTPWAAVLISAAFYAAFAVFSFKELIVLNIWLYSLSLIVELAAFVRLRIAHPDHASPVAGAGRVDRHAGRGAPADGLRAAGHGHRRLGQHAGRAGGRADRAHRLRGAAALTRAQRRPAFAGGSRPDQEAPNARG